MISHDDPLADERSEAILARIHELPADTDQPSWWEAEELAASAPRPTAAEIEATRQEGIRLGWWT